MKKEKQIVSEEVYDAINASPPWFIKNGLVLIVTIIITLLATASLISFPETVSVQLKIIPGQKPYEYKINDSLFFMRSMYKQSGAYVTKGERIADIQSKKNDSTFNIISPVDGQLFSLLDFANTSLLIQIVPKNMHYGIWASIPEKYIKKLTQNQDVSIELNNGSKLNCKISEISQFPSNGTYAIKANLAKIENSLPTSISGSVNGIDYVGKIQLSNITILQRVFHQFFHF